MQDGDIGQQQLAVLVEIRDMLARERKPPPKRSRPRAAAQDGKWSSEELARKAGLTKENLIKMRKRLPELQRFAPDVPHGMPFRWDPGALAWLIAQRRVGWAAAA